VMCHSIVRETSGCVDLYGRRLSSSGEGRSVASDSEANESISKFTHSIWTPFSGVSCISCHRRIACPRGHSIDFLLLTNLCIVMTYSRINDLHIHYIKKSIGQRTVQHTGSILWNSVPPVRKKFMSKNHLKVNFKCICFQKW